MGLPPPSPNTGPNADSTCTNPSLPYSKAVHKRGFVQVSLVLGALAWRWSGQDRVWLASSGGAPLVRIAGPGPRHRGSSPRSVVPPPEHAARSAEVLSWRQLQVSPSPRRLSRRVGAPNPTRGAASQFAKHALPAHASEPSSKQLHIACDYMTGSQKHVSVCQSLIRSTWCRPPEFRRILQSSGFIIS